MLCALRASYLSKETPKGTETDKSHVVMEFLSLPVQPLTANSVRTKLTIGYNALGKEIYLGDNAGSGKTRERTVSTVRKVLDKQLDCTKSMQQIVFRFNRENANADYVDSDIASALQEQRSNQQSK